MSEHGISLPSSATLPQARYLLRFEIGGVPQGGGVVAAPEVPSQVASLLSGIKDTNGKVVDSAYIASALTHTLAQLPYGRASFSFAIGGGTRAFLEAEGSTD